MGSDETESKQRTDIIRPDKAHGGRVATGIIGMLAAEGNDVGHVVLVCAEPDMGKTSVMNEVLAGVEGRGGKTKLVSLSGFRADRGVSRIVAVCRQMSHYIDGTHLVAVGFDDFPGADESDIQRAVRAIRKFELSGGNVIVCLAPEAEALADELSDAYTYTATDLRLSGRVVANRAHLNPDVYERLTHGIPRLGRVLLLDSEGFKDDRDADPRYLSALGEVTEHTLRRSLIWEERWARFAMVLLGSGSIDDLRFVLGDIDTSLWESIARDVPYFGIDPVREVFDCVGVTSCDCLRSVLLRLRPIAGNSPSVTVRSMELLMRRGDFRRASVVGLMCAPRERAAMVLAHAAEFIDVGSRGMVEDAISYAAEMGVLDHVREARLALSCLLDIGRDYERLRKDTDMRSISPTVGLFVEFRDRLGNSGLASADTTRSAHKHANSVGMCRSLSEVLSGLALMRELRFEEAYSYLMSAPGRRSEPTVSSCLVWCEYFISMGMSGNAPTEEDLSGYDAAVRFAGESGIPLLCQVLQSAPAAVRILAAGEDQPHVVESCAQKAALADIPFVQEMFLLASGVADLRGDTCARAFVRFQRVLDLSRQSGDSYIQGVAHILLCATKRVLGERVTTDEVLSKRMPPRVSAVARALAAVIEGSDSARLEVMGRTRMNACPGGSAWLVHVLASDFGDLSMRFKMVVPRPWLDEAHMLAIVAGELNDEVRPHNSGLMLVDAHDGAYRVDLALFGGFHVMVNGTPLSDTRIERRRAKCLLALLAVLPEHTARRYEIMETVWPDLDYHDARQRVYEATSVLRAELTTRLGIKGSPIVSSRGAGTLGLDPSCVHCDIDDFERLAKSLMSNSRLRPSDVVNGCARLERLYKGDVYVPLVDGAGMIARRREELKNLYADVLVYASQQALALGRTETAAHFAQTACRVEPIREDAEACLIRALAGAGRQLDAEASYRAFVERVAQGAKRPVSQSLRDTYHDLVCGAEELAGREGESKAASA